MIIATYGQKKALKQLILEGRGGASGWELVTRAEEERRAGALGGFEMELLAKSASPMEYWPEARRWARELMVWMRAGYAPREIPFPKEWKAVTEKVFKKIDAVNLKTSAQLGLAADWLIGFDPLDLELRSASGKSNLGLIAAEELSGPQMTAISALEGRFGAARWCDIRSDNNIKPCALKVSSAGQLSGALRELLTTQPSIKRILWLGEPARAALLEFSRDLKGVMEIPAAAPWKKEELLETFILAQEGGATPQMEFLRERAAAGELSILDVKRKEKETAEKWEREGVLEGAGIGQWQLPGMGTLRQYAEISRKLFPDEVEALEKRLKPMRRLLPLETKEMKRELWLEMLKMIGINSREGEFYGGISTMPFERAQGLIDDETLILSAGLPAPQFAGLTDPEEMKTRNGDYYRDGVSPEKGFLEMNDQRKLAALKKEALSSASWIALEGALPAEVEAQKRVYRRPPQKFCGETAPDEDLTKKHADRRSPKLPFGVNDYALPLPIKASCKQWESMVTSPELAWYELLKQKPLWRAEEDSPEALWVGNWVHAALGADASMAGIDRFFASLKNEKPSLIWQQARARAWRVARSFALELREMAGETVAIEAPVKGVLEIDAGEKILLTGRIDRVVRLGTGEILIIDFKTGSSAKPMSERSMVEGDGLQLWLYGRLWKMSAPEAAIGFCRLAPEGGLSPQLLLQDDFLPVEQWMGKIARTGILGQRGDVWGRFGGEERLPIAAIPLDGKILRARGKETYERAC